MPTELAHRVRRIRLINFHNFVNETIDVNRGGHLFLLGDNGSGKTTLLDAVHLVLTANEDVEFNAAARVVGSSRDGRRLQGIILRQNMDAQFSPSGITYAALEIESSQGKPICLALGLEAHAPDEQVRYWGVVRSCSLEELPLLCEIPEGVAPATRREMRDRLGGGGFCPDLKSYRQELIRRLYGSEDLFREACRLLRMGKAYREIAAGTSDYHELFKKLLPDPQRELFERVIRTLRELDQSKSDLAGLEEKQRYVETLAGIVSGIDKHRESALRYEWLVHHLTIREQARKMACCEEDRSRLEVDLAKLKVSIEDEKRASEELRRLLDVLRNGDSSGLLTLRAQYSNELGRLSADRERRQTEVKRGEGERSAEERAFRLAFACWRESVTQLYNALHRLRGDLPFSISEILGELDALQRADDLGEDRDLAAGGLSAETRSTQMALAGECSTRQARRGDLGRGLGELDRRIADLTAAGEVAPSVPGFREACQVLERRMIEAKPLYRELEWKPGLTGDTRAAIEEAIGQEVLSTLLVSAADYEPAAAVVFAEFPGVRLARREEAREDPAGWIREAFDFGASEPSAVRVLAEEMTARSDRNPAVRWGGGTPVLHFRSHERRLGGAPAVLIGAERRREALAREIKTLGEERKVIERAVRGLDKEISVLVARQRALDSLAKELESAPLRIANARHGATTAEARLAHAEMLLGERQAALADAVRDSRDCRQRLDELDARIAREGLDKLEAKQRKVERDLGQAGERIYGLQRQEGVFCQRIADSREHQEALRVQIAREEESQAAIEGRLRPFASGVESVAHYVLRTWRGQQFESLENVASELDRVRREESESIGILRERMNHPTYGAVYAFDYDEKINRLVDRHLSPVAEVVEAGRCQIGEQREVINERTTELIRGIIMGDLFIELKRSVFTLRKMVREINQLLSGRVFGSNRYRFRLEEEKRYGRLLEVIERLNPLDPAAQEELEHFLESCKDEITATEVNDIPEPLDYRNWFRYELAMIPETDEGEVVMNRRTKSLGSGGEQAVPNYLLILTVARFLYGGNEALRTRVMLFDEAFYGIDAGRRDQLLGFASDLGLQLFVASPDLDGVKQEIPSSTTLLVVKDEACNVHLFPCDFTNERQLSLMDGAPDPGSAVFRSELGAGDA